LFSSPRVIQSPTIALSQSGILLPPSEIRRQTKCLSSSRLAFHTEVVTVSPNSCTGFKDRRRYGLILQLEFPVCCQGPLAYLMIESSASPTSLGEPGAGLELCAAFLCCLSFSMLFCYSATSFMISNALLSGFSHSQWKLIIYHFAFPIFED
jgi:hypothetical protein